MADFSVTAGLPEPLGATATGAGVNFAVYSETAEKIFVCVFDGSDRETARLELTRGGPVFSGFVPNLAPGARYGLRADGPYDPAKGFWFDPQKLLVDPYAVTLDRPFVQRPELAAPRQSGLDTAAHVPKAIVPPVAEHVAPVPPRLGGKPGFVYEAGAKAFTARHPGVPEALRGTLRGLAHPAAVAHVAKLGVETLELMPVVAWIDERHLPPLGLRNAWGYNPVVFGALDPRLAPGGFDDLRAVVAAYHEAGVRVVLDVVFNHTGEGDALGPTLSLRGLDNLTYYRHADGDPGLLVNDTGCGNTLNVEHPAVADYILDMMRRLIETTGLDGLRLDLAAVLGRTRAGFDPASPVLGAVADDPVLSHAVLIAEPWDVGPGGYRLGAFPPGWYEWNDRYRDDVRRFFRGDGRRGALATRLAGSSDAFEKPGRLPSASVNFLAAHDGFTLADLVSYAEKHNEANGEGNRDGHSDNLSWNNGVEGVAHDPLIRAARLRDVRALLATLFVSRGTPMVSAGDELGRTQGGNNNAYAQDNEVTFLDWAHADAGLAAFVAQLAAMRKARPSLTADRFLTGRPIDESGLPDVAWLRPEGGDMTVADWEGDGHLLGMALYALEDRTVAWINAGGAASAWLPDARPNFAWTLLADSANPERAGEHADPGRIAAPARAVLVFGESPVAQPPR